MVSRANLPYMSAACVLVLAALSATPASPDDRDLLRETSADPYVFILFDTSGSMHWAPQCTQQQVDDGICEYLCPTGDCCKVFPSCARTTQSMT